MKKILIIGANGFLGTNLVNLRENKKFLEQEFYLITADILNNNIAPDLPFYSIDITDSEKTIKKVIKISPDIVILTAAMTNVDKCEEDRKLTSKINVEGAKNVARACLKANSKLILMSTDFVYDGTKNGLYNEKDIPNPLSHYGLTKYKAELAVINSQVDHLICRTAVLYGWNPEKKNFITWTLDKLWKNEKISITTTQINNATFVRNLAKIILKLIEKDATGIYHTAGAGPLSRYQMAIKCAEIFNYDKNLITPVDVLKQKAKRPNNAGLDISKLKQLLGTELKIYSLEEGLKYMKNHGIK